MTRHERRARRLARLDYKTPGESGALKPPTKGRTWHKGGRVNGHRPAPGKDWDRSGPAYVVETRGERLAEPIIHHRWRRLVADGQ